IGAVKQVAVFFGIAGGLDAPLFRIKPIDITDVRIRSAILICVVKVLVVGLSAQLSPGHSSLRFNAEKYVFASFLLFFLFLFLFFLLVKEQKRSYGRQESRVDDTAGIRVGFLGFIFLGKSEFSRGK